MASSFGAVSHVSISSGSVRMTGMAFIWIEPTTGIKFVRITGDTFQMGDLSGSGAPEEKPLHTVSLNSFWLATTEVTQEQWRKIMGHNPSSFKGDSKPVENVSWFDVQAFIRKLNLKYKQQDQFSLPSEAEWEYACRAGSTSRFSFGDSVRDLHRYANYADRSLHQEDDSFHYGDLTANDGVGRRPAPIGSYLPNAWGIHDMHGNVSEFVQDQYLTQLPGGNDPLGDVEKRSNIVIRGGAWCSLAAYCQSGFRLFCKFSNNEGHSDFRGMRVVLARKK